MQNSFYPIQQLMNNSIQKISYFLICFLIFIPISVFSISDENQKENNESIIKKHDLPESFSESASIWVLSEEDFNRGNIVNFWQLIQGRTPGMWITLDGGAPGARGSSNPISLTGQPLIVVDGLPQDSRFANGMRDYLNFLNPADIESITLLTGAAATLYGGRGGDGVILIHTKRARQGDPFTIQYSTHLSAAQPGPKVDVLDAATLRLLITQRYYDQPDMIGYLGEANTSWQDEIFSNAFSQNHNFSAAGNVATVPWRASFHYNDHAGVLLTDHLNRLGGRLSLQPSLLDNHLRFNINLHASQLENRIAPRNAISNAISFNPTQPVRDPESIFGGYFTWTSNGLPISSFISNPVALLNQTEDISITQTHGMLVNAEYSLHFFPDISLGVAAYQQTLNTEREILISDQAAWQYYSGGRYDLNEDTYSNRLQEGRINFNRKFSDNKSRIDMTAAISRQEFTRKFSVFQSNVENNMAGEPYLISLMGRGTSMRYFMSYTFGAGYAFKDLYFLSYNFRSDGSSMYLQDNQFTSYHSLAAAWKIHNESFWPQDFFLSQFKLHAALGQSGNTDIPPGYLMSFDLRPEKFNSFNLALDYGLLDNRLTGSIKYFSTEQSDVIFPVPFSSGGFLIQYWLGNIGKINQKGWEFSTNASPLKSGKLLWDLGAHMNIMKSQVTEVIHSNPNFPGYQTGNTVGGSNIFIIRDGYPVYSFFVYQNIYSPEGYPMANMYVDLNNDGMISGEDRIPFKSRYPDFLMGFNSHLRYDNWRLSLAGTIVKGNYVYNNTSMFFGHYGSLVRGNSTTDAIRLNFENIQLPSDYYVQDASYFRMDYIDLAYNFSNIAGRNLNIEVSATVQNAFVITGYHGPEPEVASGIDFNSYPRPRMFTMGVKVGF